MNSYVSLVLAPAAGGKTAHLVALARDLARDPATAPRVVVPTRLQARAWRERLAREGGALGVQIGTFDDVYRDVLRDAGTVVTRLADPVQVRLLRTLIDAASLTTYAAIRRTPGFVQALRDLIAELKAGGIFPEALTAAVVAMGAPPRLTELAQLYAAYQSRLQAEGWADYAGVGWLAAEALGRDPGVAAAWPCVMVDGFDDLTSVQLRVLAALAGRVQRLIITLTGVPGGAARESAHRRYNRTCANLEATLGITAQPLPYRASALGPAAPLRHLEQTLYGGPSLSLPAGDAVTMVAVPDREAEVRTALRWIKRAIVRQGMRPGEIALLARDLAPYRAFIAQTAVEYGLPVHMATGDALRNNPAIAALLALLQLVAPGDAHLAWRPALAAWRSPYFDWAHAYAAPGDGEPIGITPEDTEALAWVARWGRVIGGAAQWEEAFDLLCQAGSPGESRDEEAPNAPNGVPVGAQAEALRGKFARFCRRIAPPDGERAVQDHVTWLEELIGDTIDPQGDETPTSLGLACRSAEGARGLAARDLAALDALKDVLRGLVWAEEAVGCLPVAYPTFLEELIGAIDAATYRVPWAADADAVLVADVTQVRGVAYRAVAVLGIAEGEFPATLSEDPFLCDADRTQLRETFELPVEGSPESLEAQAFYEALTRPREALLLTRPRIADNGTPWQPSPFWEEVRRRLESVPRGMTGAGHPAPAQAASWPELLASVATRPNDDEAWAWMRAQQPAMAEAVARGQSVLAQRSGQTRGAFEGALTPWEATFSARFAPGRVWSASRLESYRRCPFSFFVGSVLGLEPRQPPTEGLDGRQLGNIYHHILEALYQTVGEGAQAAALLEALPDIATPILDAAPRAEGFRETAWWAQTRQAILENVRRSVAAIEALGDGFAFYQAEHTFGMGREANPALVVEDGTGDSFRVRGLIDRVDRDGAGRVRIVDYKTAGPSRYTNAAANRGETLQLALYAQAARDALGLGRVTEGLYWHVQHAEASALKLSRFRGAAGSGPEAAMDTAVAMAWEAVHGARGGHFVPVTPDGGCPGYCPAAAFCWHYEAQGW